MELSINAPVYYKEHYGIDNEVYRFAQRAHSFFKNKEYSRTVQIIGIVPVIAPPEVYAAGNYKDRVKFLCNKSVASVEMHMDFDRYHNAGSAEKINQTKEMILAAVKRISSKVDFDYDRFRGDLASLQ